MTARPMSASRARAVVEQARLVKAPDWSDTHAWHVVADGEVLVVVEPSYGGTSASGRNGWQWRLADHGPVQRRPETTIDKAKLAGLTAWERWVTWKEK